MNNIFPPSYYQGVSQLPPQIVVGVNGYDKDEIEQLVTKYVGRASAAVQ
jgi:hypothetical protein